MNFEDIKNIVNIGRKCNHIVMRRHKIHERFYFQVRAYTFIFFLQRQELIRISLNLCHRGENLKRTNLITLYNDAP